MNEDLTVNVKSNISEAYLLSEEILKNIELTEISLTNIALKTSRLARLLNDFEFQKIMEYEAGGYPTTASGVPLEVWQLGKKANRTYEEKNKKNEIVEYMYMESISSLEHSIGSFEISMSSAHDPAISISSSNPNQFIQPPTGNTIERNAVRKSFHNASNKLASRRSLIYSYALQKHYELKYSKISDDVFSRIRLRVDSSIGNTIPEAVKQFTAIYENLKTENTEDWSNAVHSCRRILQSLADSLYPPCDDKKIIENGKEKIIKLGSENDVLPIFCTTE